MATAGECINIVCLRCFHNKYGVPLSIARKSVTGISKSKGPSSEKPVCNLRIPIAEMATFHQMEIRFV